MPIYREDADRLLLELHNSLCGTLFNHYDFLNKLADDSDWAFVIKVHAFIEAIITQLLVDSVGDERYKKIFERLPLSDEVTGKLALAKDLDLLTNSQRRFIRYFSTLRNRLAHRIENIDFSFEKYLKELDQSQKKSWWESILWFCEDEETKNIWKKVALDAPRTTLWFASFLLISISTISAFELKGNISINNLSLKTGEKLFESIKLKKL